MGEERKERNLGWRVRGEDEDEDEDEDEGVPMRRGLKSEGEEGKQKDIKTVGVSLFFL